MHLRDLVRLAEFCDRVHAEQRRIEEEERQEEKSGRKQQGKMKFKKRRFQLPTFQPLPISSSWIPDQFAMDTRLAAQNILKKADTSVPYELAHHLGTYLQHVQEDFQKER